MCKEHRNPQPTCDASRFRAISSIKAISTRGILMEIGFLTKFMRKGKAGDLIRKDFSFQLLSKFSSEARIGVKQQGASA